MGIAIALGFFGLLCGAVVRNRVGGAFTAAAGAFMTWLALPSVYPLLDNSPKGHRIAAMLTSAGGDHPSLFMFLGAAAAGVLLAWMLFGAREHRPDWEWDPEHPKRRKRRRRLYAAE